MSRFLVIMDKNVSSCFVLIGAVMYFLDTISQLIKSYTERYLSDKVGVSYTMSFVPAVMQLQWRLWEQ